MKKLFLILFLIPNLASAMCAPVTYLKAGQSAPCEGYLFTPSEEEELRLKVQRYDQLNVINEKQDELIKVLSNRLDNSIQMNYNLKQQLERNKDQNSFEQGVYFVLGIVIGIGTSKAFK